MNLDLVSQHFKKDYNSLFIPQIQQGKSDD